MMRLACLAVVLAPSLLLAADAVSVRIEAPATQRIGPWCKIRLVTTGDVVSRKVMLLPEGSTGLEPLNDDGSTYALQTDQPGTYVLIAAVATKEGGVAMAYHSLELTVNGPTTPPTPVKATPQTKAPPPAKEEAYEYPEPVDESVETIIRRITGKVQSASKADDLAQIRSALTMTAGRYTSSPAANVSGGIVGASFGTVRDQVFVALGSDAARFQLWNHWLSDLQRLFEELQRQKGITDAATFAAALRNTAKVLETCK